MRGSNIVALIVCIHFMQEYLTVNKSTHLNKKNTLSFDLFTAIYYMHCQIFYVTSSAYVLLFFLLSRNEGSCGTSDILLDFWTCVVSGILVCKLNFVHSWIKQAFKTTITFGYSQVSIWLRLLPCYWNFSSWNEGPPPPFENTLLVSLHSSGFFADLSSSTPSLNAGVLGVQSGGLISSLEYPLPRAVHLHPWF